MRPSIVLFLFSLLCTLVCVSVLSLPPAGLAVLTLYVWPFSKLLRIWWPLLLVAALLSGVALGLLFHYAFLAEVPPASPDRDSGTGQNSVSPVEALVTDTSFALSRWVAVLGLLLLALAATASHEMPFTGVLLAFAFACVAILAGISVVERLSLGDEFEVQSHWGGIGGSIGGWRMSPATGLAVIAVLFALASFAVAPSFSGIRAPAQSTAEK